MRTSITRLEAFEANVFRPDDPCWIWRSHVGRQGYGTLVYRGVSQPAHRVSYELHVGPIPEGLEIHHRCFNRQCVKPSHLKAVTHEENLRESRSVGAVNAAKTHCVNGHEFTPENTMIRPTKTGSGRGRQCRQCHRENGREEARLRKGFYERQAVREKQCKNGHPWVEENIYTGPTGTQWCRPCRLERERARRGPPAPRATHCRHGHEFTEKNTYEYEREGSTYRYCRECNRQAARKKKP